MKTIVTTILLCLILTSIQSAEPADIVAGLAQQYLAAFSDPKEDAKWDKQMNGRAEQAEKDGNESLQNFSNRAIQDRFFTKREQLKTINDVSKADMIELCRYVAWVRRSNIVLPSKVTEPLYTAESIETLTKWVSDRIAEAKK